MFDPGFLLLEALMTSETLTLRVFDNPRYNDRYTVVFDDGDDILLYVGMSAEPFHPQGFCQHGEVKREWMNENKDTEITFDALPEDCKKAVQGDLRELSPTSH